MTSAHSGAVTSSIRKAATTLLLTDVSPSQFQVLMMKRPPKTRFMANVYVFPGGGVDEQDGRMAVTVSEALRHSCPLAEFRVAAVRELFEESGVAVDATGAASTPEPPCSFDAKGGFTFTPFAHWVTPKQEKLRNDTWFFVKECAPGFSRTATLRPQPGEVADMVWVSPEDAIRRHENDADADFRLPPPTYLIMKELSAFRNSKEVIASREEMMSKARDVFRAFPEIEPTLLIREGKLCKMYMRRHEWVPESVVPRKQNADGTASDEIRTTRFPVYTKEGKKEFADVIIGAEAPRET